MTRSTFGNAISPMVQTYGAIALAMSLGACTSLPVIGGTSWKEEVLLHDGSTIIVSRSVERGGRHEVGQQPPIKEQTLRLTLPATNERITWKSEFSKDVGLADFQPMLVDIYEGTVYVVTHPVGCLAYNKWGRPNPPYVVFKYQDKAWVRINLTDLPAEIKSLNIIFGSPDNEVQKLGTNFVKVEDINTINRRLKQPEYQRVLREALAKERIKDMCEERVLYKGHWILPDDPIARKFIDNEER